MDTLRGRMRRHPVVPGESKRARKLICGRYRKLYPQSNNDMTSSAPSFAFPETKENLLRHALPCGPLLGFLDRRSTSS